MSESNLKKGMLQILFANIINMFFSIGTNFLLPKYLSMETYSQIKTYQLYIAYVAVLHLGYNDGMFLEYGGKTIQTINCQTLEKNFSTLRIFQFLVMIFSLFIAIFLNNYLLIITAIVIFPQNITAYLKNFFQSIGEFKKYSNIMNLTTGCTFAINIFMVCIMHTDQYLLYLLAYLILNIVIWLFLEKSLRQLLKIKLCIFKFSWYELKKSISNGILLLLGNFSSQLLTSMDRWFVKIMLGTFAFAQYAFAVSMENFLNIALTPLTITLYNYFCRHDSYKDIYKMREFIIAFSTIVVSIAFPIKFILEHFLIEYYESYIVIFVLFSAQFFYIIIKSVYVNLYKAKKMQKKYFFKLCSIVIFSFLFNIIFYMIYPKKESFSIGTLLSAIIWFFLCQMDFKELRYQNRHYIFIFLEVFIFLICGIFLNALVGGIIYLIFSLLMIFYFMPYAYKKSILVLLQKIQQNKTNN